LLLSPARSNTPRGKFSQVGGLGSEFPFLVLRGPLGPRHPGGGEENRVMIGDENGTPGGIPGSREGSPPGLLDGVEIQKTNLWGQLGRGEKRIFPGLGGLTTGRR